MCCVVVFEGKAGAIIDRIRYKVEMKQQDLQGNESSLVFLFRFVSLLYRPFSGKLESGHD